MAEKLLDIFSMTLAHGLNICIMGCLSYFLFKCGFNADNMVIKCGGIGCGFLWLLLLILYGWCVITDIRKENQPSP